MMACPICDQKPMNCDCTVKEREQHAEIEELRLTDAEREAIVTALAYLREDIDEKGIAIDADALRGLLERLK
jgi:hypothetical protein